MTIRQTRRFVKQLAKQPAEVRQAYYNRLRIFAEDPHNPLLRDHALRGQLKGFYSINITGDVKAIYMVVGNDIYIFDLIGTHAQLYG